MFCINCGKKVEDDWSFCDNCGFPVEDTAATTSTTNSTAPSDTTNAANTTDSAQTATVSTANPTNAANPNSESSSPINNKNNKKTKRKVIIISIIVSLVIVLAAAIGIFAYFANNKVYIPKSSQLKNMPVNTIESNLKKQGLTVEVKKEFNKLKSGSYIRLNGANPGSYVLKSNKITIVESIGPGVPEKGVIGASLSSAKEVIKDMGVEIKIHQVVSNNKKDGEVIGADPMPGNSVINPDHDAIHLAVASKGKGIPIDLFGMDKEAALKKLESLGFKDVMLTPHFSSKKMLGKIVGSYPSLGSSVTNGHIDLLYGIDASKTKEALSSYVDHGKSYIIQFLDPLLGKWCTKSGNCINIEKVVKQYSSLKNLRLSLYTVNGKPDLSDDNLSTSAKSYVPNSDNIDVDKVDANSSDEVIKNIFDSLNLNITVSKDKKTNMRNHLIAGDSGAVEFYNGSFPYCGTSPLINPFNYKKICDHGVLKDLNANEIMDIFHAMKDTSKWSGMNYRINDFYVAFPVNSKLKKVEDSGYFKGSSSNQPDLNRPFILRRDPKLYDKKVIPFTGTYNTVNNPFVPTVAHKPVPFAPAPDDNNAYYFVEQPFDWSSLK